MLHHIPVFLIVLLAFLRPAFALDKEATTSITVIDAAMLNEARTASVQCTLDSLPGGVYVAPTLPGTVREVEHQPIDNTGTPIDLATLTDASRLLGGGYRVSVVGIGNGALPRKYTVGLLCTTTEFFDPGIGHSIVREARLVQPGERVNLTNFCPTATGTAIGNMSNGGERWFRDFGSAPVWGDAGAPLYLGNLPDGTMGAPTGWEYTAQNIDTVPRTMAHLTYCGKVTGLATRITSTPTSPAQPFTIAGPVPDTHRFVGLGFDGGLWGRPLDNSLFWFRDGRTTVDNAFNPAIVPSAQNTYTDTGIRETLFHGVDIRPVFAVSPKATARAVLATLMVPKSESPPVPAVVTIVEFVNATLRHYFITANPQEISDLDHGVHKGWERTGQEFKAYGIGSAGRVGRQPVCRAYGNPAAGLDSHFYSASIDECYATLSKFEGIWLLESSEVFEMDLPDVVTGACPAGGVPIYRLFNNRADANHRYTNSPTLRDVMAAQGFIKEGYGPDSVTLCGLP